MPANTVIQVRRDTAANWVTAQTAAGATPVLAAGEIGFETDTSRFKIGNGSSLWGALSYFQAGASVGAMNYVQTKASRQVGVSSNGSTIVSLSITTNGYPVKIDATGDFENSAATAWVVLAIYRDGTKVGQNVHAEASAASENNPFALTVIDTPSAGTYTYAVKIVNAATAGGTFNWGETEGPVLTAIELSGPKGDTGATGTVTTSSLTIGTTGLTTTAGTSPWNGSAAATIDIDTAKVPRLTTNTNTFVAATNATTLVVKVGPTQGTTNLMEWQTSGGVVGGYVRNDANAIIFGGVYATYNMTVDSGAAGSVPLVVTGAVSQTANLQEWKNSSGTVVASLANFGSLTLTSSLNINGGNSPITLQGVMGSFGQVLKSNGTASTPSWGDMFYPTAVTMGGGTTAGPTVNLTMSGTSNITGAAIPSASNTASGIVTTAAQTFAGRKTFEGGVSITGAATTVQMQGDAGTSGYVLTSRGGATTPTWSELPYRIAANRSTVSAGTALAVNTQESGVATTTFPVGRFSAAPAVVASTSSPRYVIAVSSVTTSGFTFTARNVSDATGGTYIWNWIAVEITAGMGN